jgi:hypothetical protein
MRSLYNERNDFLLTTFPIADANKTAPSPIIFPQIADGGGYATQFIFINTNNASLVATLSYLDSEGSKLAIGQSAVAPFHFADDILWTSPDSSASITIVDSCNQIVPANNATFKVLSHDGSANLQISVGADGTVSQSGPFGNQREGWIVTAKVEGLTVLGEVFVLPHNTQADRQILKTANWRVVVPRAWIRQSFALAPEFSKALDVGWIGERELLGLSWEEARMYAQPNEVQVSFDTMAENADACGYSGDPINISNGCFFYPNGIPRWFVYYHELGHNFSLAQQARAAFSQIFKATSTYIEGDASLLAVWAMHKILTSPFLDSATKQTVQYGWDQETKYWLSELLKWETEATSLPYTDDNTTFNANMYEGIHLRFIDQYGWDYIPRYVRAWRNDPLVLEKLGIVFPNGGTTLVHRATFVAAAISAAIEKDVRAQFKLWSFPIDDALFDDLFPYLKNAVAQPWDVGPISVEPASLSIKAGATQKFSVALFGPTTVQWSIEEGPVGGRIDATGQYTAPAWQGVFHALATNTSDPTQYFSIPVLVTE